MTKTYCGNAKEIETKYGKLLKLSFTKEDIQALQDNLADGWVNAVVKERKEPSPTGISHYLELDLWKPEKKEASKEEIDSSMPF